MNNAYIWRKSSYSAGQGECVEVGWRKSSYSADQGECVEVSVALTVVAIRDSKNRATGHLNVQAAGWHTFLDGLKHT